MGIGEKSNNKIIIKKSQSVEPLFQNVPRDTFASIMHQTTWHNARKGLTALFRIHHFHIFFFMQNKIIIIIVIL